MESQTDQLERVRLLRELQNSNEAPYYYRGIGSLNFKFIFPNRWPDWVKEIYLNFYRKSLEGSAESNVVSVEEAGLGKWNPGEPENSSGVLAVGNGSLNGHGMLKGYDRGYGSILKAIEDNISDQ